MGKYEPLKIFLKAQRSDRVSMTFVEIEGVLGSALPPSKLNRAWWSNNRSNNVMTKEWLDAGFETEAVDIPGERLVFRRVELVEGEMKSPGFAESPQAGFDAPQVDAEGMTRPRHPGFGFMKGLIEFAPDFDPTAPAFPDWEDYEDRKYGKGSKLHE